MTDENPSPKPPEGSPLSLEDLTLDLSRDPRPGEPLSQPVHLRWILFGSLAMIVGILMGYVMSSLGR